MKLVLVIDAPVDCMSCEYSTAYFCKQDNHRIANNYRDKIGKIDEQCPFKPLPRKLDANDWCRLFNGNYEICEAKGYGWNACIDEILGEEK